MSQRQCVRKRDPAHTLWKTGSVIFCTRCGCRTSTRIRLLAQKCLGSCSGTRKSTLSRMNRGLDPTEDRFLGPPVPYYAPIALRDGIVLPRSGYPDPDAAFQVFLEELDIPGLIGERLT